MEIIAAVAHEPGKPFRIQRLRLDAPRPDEILVRVHSTGVCHTDISVKEQLIPIPLPAVLGHEGAGVVEEVGAHVTKVKPGDHVIMTFDSCGRCQFCASGHPAYCTAMRSHNMGGCRLDGSCTIHGDTRIGGSFFGQSTFATHALVMERNVVTVPKDIDLAILGQLGCGIQTGAGAVLNVLKPAPGSSLLVSGAGSVGIAAIMAAKATGCSTIVALDIKKERLDAARALGATDALNATTPEIADKLRALSGIGFTNVIDTTALPDVISMALSVLAPLGTCVLLGAGAAKELQVNISWLMSGGRSIRGIVEGDSLPDVFIPLLIELYRKGLFPIDKLITRFSLDRINEACAAALAGTVVKPVLIMPH